MKLGISASAVTLAALGALLLGGAPAQAGGGYERGIGHGHGAPREVVRSGGKLGVIGHRYSHASHWAAYRMFGYPHAIPSQHRQSLPVRQQPPMRPAPPPLPPAHLHGRAADRYRVPAHRHVSTSPPPVPATATHPVQAYAAPERHPQRCQHAAEPHPYQERIIYERYERVINRAPPTERYDDREIRY